jgi:hypothetical protein
MKILPYIILLMPMPGSAQNLTNKSDINPALITFTKDYFEAFNSCDVEKMMAFNSDDIELYTDFAGTTFGESAVRQQLKNFCSYTSGPDKPTMVIELMADPAIHKLLTKDDHVYGALVQGTVQYYKLDKSSGLMEDAGTTDFFWVLKYANDKWLITRDVSFNFQNPKDKK